MSQKSTSNEFHQESDYVRVAEAIIDKKQPISTDPLPPMQYLTIKSSSSTEKVNLVINVSSYSTSKKISDINRALSDELDIQFIEDGF